MDFLAAWVWHDSLARHVGRVAGCVRSSGRRRARLSGAPETTLLFTTALL